MAIDIKPLEVADLTQAKVDGIGAFDVLMRAMVGHLTQEFEKGRIRGADYANVYLNAMAPVLQNAVVFLLQKDEAANKAALVEAQIKLTEAQAELVRVEIEREGANKELIQAQIDRIRREITSADLADAHTSAQTANISKQTENLASSELLIQAQTAEQKAQTINTGQQLLNLKAQECVLKTQYDMNLSQNLQIVAQTSLVNQKVATEKAQTAAGGVEADSVIGKQKLLYTAQTDGFKRDAEQKAAKLLADTWNVRRTTDAGTVADTTNGLSDANIGRAVSKMLAGVGA